MSDKRDPSARPSSPLSAAAASLRAGWEAENRAVGLRFVAAHEVMTECMNHPDCADDAAEPRPGYSVVEPDVMAGSYLVRELAISSKRAESMISFAADLHFRYPAILQAMLDGLMEEWVARGLARQMSCVSEDVLAQVQDEVVKDYLDGLEAGVRLGVHARNARADEIIGKYDKDGVRERKADAARDRGIWIRKGQDGMSSMSAILRSDEAAVLAEALEEKVVQDREADEDAQAAATAAAEAAGEPAPVFEDDPDYTLAQRRADALMSLACGDLGTPNDDAGTDNGASTATATATATGTGTGTGTGGGLMLRPRITVITNPAGGNTPHATTTGSTSSAGVDFSRTGEGALQSLLDLLAAADGATIEQVDPTIGAADDADASLRYRPSAALARRIRLRDGTCRHPGCAVPAEHCDLDHCIPFNRNDPASGGRTVEQNMGALCRTHHRFKTFSGWGYKMDPDGTLIITTPDGKVMVTRPSGPLAEYRRWQAQTEAKAWQRQQRRHKDPDKATTTTGTGAGAGAGSGIGGLDGQVYAEQSGWARRAKRQDARREESRAAVRAKRERTEAEHRDIFGQYSKAELGVQYCLHMHRSRIDRLRRAKVHIVHPPGQGNASQAEETAQGGSRWWDNNKAPHEAKQFEETLRRFREELDDPPPF